MLRPPADLRQLVQHVGQERRLELDKATGEIADPRTYFVPPDTFANRTEFGFEIRTREPMPVNADGEIVTQTPAVFRVRPGAIRVFVP